MKLTEYSVRLRNLRTQLQRVLRMLSRAFIDFTWAGAEQVVALRHFNSREPRPCQAVVWIEFHRVFQVLGGGVEGLVRDLVSRALCLEVQLISVEVLRATLLATQFSTHQFDAQRLYDRIGDVVLRREYITQLAIVGLRPQVIAVVGANELRGHSQ